MTESAGRTADDSQAGRQPERALGKWLALAAALLGWMFDGAEMGLFSMVGRSAMRDLLNTTDDGKVGLWFSIIIAIFLIGAATGGVLFGWLGDRIGRVRAMSLSVLTYAIFTGLCGIADSAYQVAALRFVASLGMGGEWSLGVALVMEVWPNRSRGLLAGLIGAAANVGYLLVGVVGLVLAGFLKDLGGMLASLGLGDELVARLVSHDGWRILMILGAAPALLTFLIRLFVPESPRWKSEKAQGATSHWATVDLLAVLAGAGGAAMIVAIWALPLGSLGFSAAGVIASRVFCTLIGLAITTAGYIYPVLRYLQRQGAQEARDRIADTTAGTVPRMLLAASLSGVALLGTWGSSQWAPTWASKLVDKEYGVAAGPAASSAPSAASAPDAPPAKTKPKAKEWTQIWLALGAIAGTIAGALAGDWFGRRVTYAALCVASLGSAWLLFQTNDAYGTKFLACAFVGGFFTAAFYGWLPLYLPELFRTRVRATGQGFGFNFGRILAAIGTLQVGFLVNEVFDGDYAKPCSIAALIYLVGIPLILLAPETKGKPLPE